MRGHARGPFNPGAPLFPVMRVQRQIFLAPGVSETIHIEASPTQPVFLKAVAWVQEAAESALLVKLGTVASPESIFAGANTDTEVIAIGTEKRFVLVANTSLVAQMSGTAGALGKVVLFLDA